MTMHLVKGMFSTTSHKPDFKMTKKKQKEWELAWAEDNKVRKRQGQSKLSFDQYCNQRLGKIKSNPAPFTKLTSSNNLHPRYNNQTNIPSLNTMQGNTNRKETLEYSGEQKLLGIAVLHKSCLQPVFSKQDAVDIARMRR